MNALTRWWGNLTLPNPAKPAANLVHTEFMLGSTRVQIWRECMASATRMRERGVNEPWLQRYLTTCKNEITALHGVDHPEADG